MRIVLRFFRVHGVDWPFFSFCFPRASPVDPARGSNA